MIKKTVLVGVIAFSLFTSCKKDVEEPIPETKSLYEPGEEVLGGIASTFSNGRRAFEEEISNLTINQKLDFFTGNAFFKQAWVPSPSTTTARDGLGPFFNAKACSSCHPADGRGRPPLFPGERQEGLLFRLSRGVDANGFSIPDPTYGGQLQDLAIQTIDFEGEMDIMFEEIIGLYGDGEAYTIRKPSYSVGQLSHGALHSDTKISPRIGSQVIGLGLLDAISEADILANADENDSDGDGISGRANWVWDFENNETRIGRFGWKANQPSLRQQIAGAFSGDLGITSSIFPDENCNGWVDCDTVANGGNPELTDALLDQSELYLAALSVPIRRNFKETDVLQGKILFAEIGCNSCHIDEFVTSESPTLAQLNNQKIKPYTDMLLHDMGDSLADNSPDFLATGNEWRTPPLWGIGLLKTINGHEYLLHDGRARNIEEAVLWHGGEALASKQKFKQLNKSKREQLIKFLESL